MANTKRITSLLPLLLAGVLCSGAVEAGGLLDLADIIAHPDQYDRQEVVVSGQVTRNLPRKRSQAPAGEM